jgi:hypothetical protein
LEEEEKAYDDIIDERAPLGSNNDWLMALERVLYEKSGNQLEFVKLKNSKKDKEEGIVNPSTDEIVVLAHKWRDPNETFQEKLSIWKRLAIMHESNV